MSEAEAVSVIVAAHNGASTIMSTLRSALDQQPGEVLVVDDGSRDATPDLVAGIAESRVRLVALDRGVGVSRARAIGVEQSRGRWLAFLDQDDLWAPDRLVRLVAAAERTGAESAYSAAIRIHEDGAPFRLDPAPELKRLLPRLLATDPMPGGASNLLVTRDAFAAVGGFDESLHIFEDWDLWIRLVARRPPARSPEPLVAHRVHAGSALLADDIDLDAELTRLTTKHAHLLRAYGQRVNGFEQYRVLALRRWAVGRRREAVDAVEHGIRRHFSLPAARLIVQQLARAPLRGRRERPPSPAWLRG